MPRRAAVVTALRTPVGRFGGSLATVRPDDLAAHIIRGVVERSGIDPGLIDDVYLGAANQAGEDNRDVARMSVLLAGLPETIPGATVNRLCASGLEAINIAARMIEAGHGDAFIAGGVESMSRAPYVLGKAEGALARDQQLQDTTLGWRFINPRLAERFHPYSMGETAENVARKHSITREDQDRFALRSQQRWATAQAEGRFTNEILPVPVPQRRGDPIIFAVDEHPRPDTTLEKLASLAPAFARDGLGTVTAGNSSGINDGAAAVLLVEATLAERLGLSPLALVSASASAGVDPAYMGIGPVPAIRKALGRAGLALDAIDLIELNEAFAAQAVACARELHIDEARLNVSGGAIAIGHPLGSTGARLATTLVHEMTRSGARRGLVSLCIGVGQGLATLFERPA
jgi:3-oxoadipyl-CoA thiolase